MGRVLKRHFLLLAVVAAALLLASGVALGQTAPPAPKDGREVAAEKVEAHAHHHGVFKAPVSPPSAPQSPWAKNHRTRRQSPPTPRPRSTPSTRST